MATVVVHPVAFRLVEEHLLVWLARPLAESDSAGFQPSLGSRPSQSPERIERNGVRAASSEYAARPLGHGGATTLSLPQPDRLPGREIGESESDTEALERLLATLPFQRQIVRRKHCAVFAEPGRVARRREIGLISWVLVRSPPAALAAVSAQAASPAGSHVGSHVGQAQPGQPPEGSGAEHPEGAWVAVDHLPALLDDHRAVIEAAYRSLGAEILHDAVTRRVLPRHLLRSAADQLTLASSEGPTPPALFGLLPDPFPLSAIRRFYERLLGAEIDRGNFRRKLVELRPTGILKELPIFQRGVRHRAAQLFTFDAKAWERWAATEEAADDGS